ncbi:MAG: TolC family protein [Synoicihabitans sp.]
MTGFVAAQTTETSSAAGTLTLEDAIVRALQKNFSLQIQGYETATAEAQVDIAASGFDPSLSVNAQKNLSQQASPGSILDGTVINGPRTDRDNLRITANQEIAATGARLQVGGNLRRNETNSRNALINPAYNSDAFVSINQPLLKGFGSEVTKAALNRARIGLDRAGYDYRTAVLDVVRNVEVSYYNLAFAREQLKVRLFSRDLAQQLLEENQAKKDSGVATDLDVLQAQFGVANAERDILLAEKTVKDREDQLIAQIDQFGFAQGVAEVDLGQPNLTSVTFDKSYQLARENRPDYASRELSIEQLRISERVAKGNKKPTLDLGASVGLNNIQASGGDAVQELWSGDGYSWGLELALTVPWGLRDEKARHAQALANLSREKTRLLQLEQTIMVDVRSAIRTVETSIEALRISQLSSRLSEEQYELEKARFDAGLSTFRRVQEAQEDVDTARVRELQAEVSLAVAHAELLRLEGTSLDRFDVDDTQPEIMLSAD